MYSISTMTRAEASCPGLGSALGILRALALVRPYGTGAILVRDESGDRLAVGLPGPNVVSWTDGQGTYHAEGLQSAVHARRRAARVGGEILSENYFINSVKEDLR